MGGPKKGNVQSVFMYSFGKKISLVHNYGQGGKPNFRRRTSEMTNDMEIYIPGGGFHDIGGGIATGGGGVEDILPEADPHSSRSEI